MTGIAWDSTNPLILSGKMGRKQGNTSAPEGPWAVDNTASFVDPPVVVSSSGNTVQIVAIITGVVVVAVLLVGALWLKRRAAEYQADADESPYDDQSSEDAENETFEA